MLREDFFDKFFQYNKTNSHGLIKYNSNKKLDLQNKISIRIQEIDKKIAENTTALIEAQIVKLRSTFSTSSNFVAQIGKNVYKTKLENSIDWHQNQLNELYFERRELEINLEKIKGIFWFNRLKRFLRILALGFFVVLGVFIFLSGFMIIIYLLPIIILIFLGFFISTKKY
tara:strand:+ start:30 stop:542 length:513 start_codon:yes stop_codon:yes gene_type:complete